MRKDGNVVRKNNPQANSPHDFICVRSTIHCIGAFLCHQEGVHQQTRDIILGTVESLLFNLVQPHVHMNQNQFMNCMNCSTRIAIKLYASAIRQARKPERVRTGQNGSEWVETGQGSASSDFAQWPTEVRALSSQSFFTSQGSHITSNTEALESSFSGVLNHSSHQPPLIRMGYLLFHIIC